MDHPVEPDIHLIQSIQFDGLLIQDYASRQNPHETAETLKFIKKLDMPNKHYVVLLPFFSYKNLQDTISTQDAKQVIEAKGIKNCALDTMCVFESNRANTFDIPCGNYFQGKFLKIQ
jgi:hypothetical protein